MIVLRYCRVDVDFALATRQDCPLQHRVPVLAPSVVCRGGPVASVSSLTTKCAWVLAAKLQTSPLWCRGSPAPGKRRLPKLFSRKHSGILLHLSSDTAFRETCVVNLQPRGTGALDVWPTSFICKYCFAVNNSLQVLVQFLRVGLTVNIVAPTFQHFQQCAE